MNTSATSANSRGMTTGPLLALALLALIWGYNWVVMKIAMQYVGPMDFAALRGVFGTVLLFAVLWAVGAPLRPQHVGKTLLLGATMLAAGKKGSILNYNDDTPFNWLGLFLSDRLTPV